MIIAIPGLATTALQGLKQTDLFDYYGLQAEDRPFWKYHQDNPEIYDMFKFFALQVIAAGHGHFGAKAIFERIRFESYLNHREAIKLNNNYTGGYARLFMRDFPQHKDFFRTRQLKTARNMSQSQEK